VSLLTLLVLGAVLLSCDSKETDPGREAPAHAAFESTPVSKEVEPSPSREKAPRATRVVLLGSGNPVPDPLRSGPAVVILSQGQSYLVDFGPGVVRRVAAAQRLGLRGLDFRTLTRVFVTHLHSDHTAGYPDLILTPAGVGREEPLQVYGPPGIRRMTEAVQEAFREDVEMRRLHKDGGNMRGYLVESHEVKPGLVYQDDSVKVIAFEVEHGSWEHAYGYRFETPDRSIVISGDTAPTNAVIEACNGCDLLMHEVYCEAGFKRGKPDWQSYHSGYHTSTVELARVAEKARPKLLVLYHVLFFGCSAEQLLSEVRREYRGRIALGQDLAVY
jgi:ribonuclease Z